MTPDYNTLRNIDTWQNGNFDEATKKEIKQLFDRDNHEEILDSFYKKLSFGTGGLRGIMGVGSNRINKYTIGTATQGLCNYLKKKFPTEKIKVVVAHDSRNHSNVFANITADVFSANGIHVYFFDGLRPTPELSFAIRKLACKSGVMITASHNPKEYNGYKAYDNEGCQYTDPDDLLVMQEVNKVEKFDEINFNRIDSNIELIGENIDEMYLNEIEKLSLSKEAIKRQNNLKIVFSPIHGTGITLVPKALQKFGFTNVHLVEEQSEPNGNFPTVVYPNPEEKEALTLSLKKAKEIDADLVLATDPDADRVGMAVKDNDGNFVLLNGNETGSLLLNYLLNAWQKNNKLDGKQYIVKTIVTTNLIEKIAQSKNVTCHNTLTGFKFIGKLITELQGKNYFIGGGEESYGYSVGELVRDKDAVISCAFIAEMAAYYADQNKSLYDALIEMYLEYGFYKEELISITKEGKSGAEEISKMMESFRKNPPKTLGGAKIITLKDYELGTETDLLTQKTTPLNYQKSDVLQFITEDGSIISARPSGTEPKIKFYCSVNTKLKSATDFKSTSEQLSLKIKHILNDLGV